MSNRGPSAYQPNALPLGQTPGHWANLISSCTKTRPGNAVTYRCMHLALPVQCRQLCSFLLRDAVTSLPSLSEILSLQSSSNFFFFSTSFITVICRQFGSPFLGKPQQPQEQLPIAVSVCSIYLFIQTTIWLQVLGIFNVHTDVEACECQRGLYRRRKRVCTENCVSEKNPLTHR